MSAFLRSHFGSSAFCESQSQVSILAHMCAMEEPSTNHNGLLDLEITSLAGEPIARLEIEPRAYTPHELQKRIARDCKKSPMRLSSHGKI